MAEQIDDLSEAESLTRQRLRLVFSGFLMGAADIVPGVSGGTIAFILGIYERLLSSIKVFTGEVPRLLLRRRFRAALDVAPLGFVLPLGIGLVVAAVSLANVITWLLEEHPTYLWSLFFGLVSASLFLVGRRVRRWTAAGVAAFAAAAVAAYVLVGLTPSSTPDTPLAFFLSGAIAICAMILPGISGSFILVLLGKYDQVLDAVVQRDVLTLAVFFLGAAVGIAVFSRILSWLFSRYHDLVILILCGLMLGSLRKVWPWKETLSTRIDRHGDEVPLQQANYLPDLLNLEVAAALLLCLAGAAIVLLISRIEPKLPAQTRTDEH